MLLSDIHDYINVSIITYIISYKMLQSISVQCEDRSKFNRSISICSLKYCNLSGISNV